MITKNGVEIQIDYSEQWEKKLAEALFNLYIRIEKRKHPN